MGDLQFDRAEFDEGKTRVCASCRQDITAEYYSVNGHVICGGCRDHLGSARRPVTTATLLSAITLGGLAAVVGAAVWGGITYRFGTQLGIVAVIVGLGVGYAVSRGSERAGGWLFQGVAIALTYLAIAGSWIPVLLREAPSANFFGIASVALTMPVQYATSSVLGLLINSFALYEAWKVNKRQVIRIAGPFSLRHVPREAPTSG